MGQPDEDLLEQSPGKSNNHARDTQVAIQNPRPTPSEDLPDPNSAGRNILDGDGDGESSGASAKLVVPSSASSPVKDDKGKVDDDVIRKRTGLNKTDFPTPGESGGQEPEQEQEGKDDEEGQEERQEVLVIHSRQHPPHPPRLGSESRETVKNNSQESGLSTGSGCDCVSLSLSSSESFSGSEDISPKALQREPVTTEGSSTTTLIVVVERDCDCQEGIDVVQTQREGKLDEDEGHKRKDELDSYRNDQFSSPNSNEDGLEGNDDLFDLHDKTVGDEHGSSNNPSDAVDKATGGSVETCGRNAEGSCCCQEESSTMMSMMSTENKRVGEGEVFTTRTDEGTGSCPKDSCPPPPTATGGNGKGGGNQSSNENIWTFPATEVSSSTTTAQQPEHEEMSGGKQQNQDSSRPSREKKRVFGLSGFGCRFNLNKIFSSSSRATHSSNERLNNQLSPHEQQERHHHHHHASSSDGAQALAITSATLLSNVSKSSSESNILMCHNSLDNLTDDLPSSRSTDSSCLIPTMTADDDQVLDHHQHHRHNHRPNVLEETCQCASCCTCCCCESNGTCDHHLGESRNRIGNGCLSHSTNRCSSSPATVGRRLQMSGNVDFKGSDDCDDDVADDDDANPDLEDVAVRGNIQENGLVEETNNNNHQVGDVQTPNNHFTGGNNSNLVEGPGNGTTNSRRNHPNNNPTSLSSSSSGVTVIRNQIGRSVELEEAAAACGSSLSYCHHPNKNGDDRDSNFTDDDSRSAKTSEPSTNHRHHQPTGNEMGANITSTEDARASPENSPTPGTLTSCCSSSESSSCNSYSEASANSGGSGESCSASSSTSHHPSAAIANSSSSSASTHTQKFKLLSEGDVQVCRVKHGKNLVDKVIGSKLLRRWETHHLYLNDACISSKTPLGPMATPVPYWQMEEVYVCVRLDSKRRYVIRIVIPDGSLLLQGSNAYVRDQWYYSILWKKNIYKYQNLMRSSKRPEVILKELKSLVNFATTTPLQDDCISHVPVEIVSNLLDSAGELLGKNQAEEVLVALSPLLERSHPPPSLCRFFSKYCRSRPRCPLVAQLFTPVVRRALKHNVDFGKYPYMRRFIQDYIQALNCHNDGINVVRNFVKSIHGPASSCPHPRVMSNLVSVCLAAMFKLFEKNSNKSNSSVSMESIHLKEIPYDEQLLCYLAIFDTISEFEDWRPSLAQLFQPIPFPDEALNNPLFTRSLASVIRRIGTDHRCEVHTMVLGIRDGKEGWFHLYAPSNQACFDEGDMWGMMLGRLLACCCRRKRFLSQLGGDLLGSTMLLALRENAAAQEALCLLLEWQLVQSDDQRVQIATTLQSTPTGSANYIALCNRQLHLKELQQKGGPRKLNLPSRSTDKDLAKLLSCGSFGNLECLSLAFTQVTSACAEQLIKLPSLRYLNFWSTQFGDAGLQLISEHLPNLQVLNLCETPVTDKGLLCLTCMTSLRKLNLNSTHLSVQTFERLKKQLPALKDNIDVRYTDAWPGQW